MLFKCKTRKAITALFIFLFLFQLIPNYYINSDCFDDKINKSSLILPFRVYESKIVFLNIDNQKVHAIQF